MVETLPFKYVIYTVFRSKAERRRQAASWYAQKLSYEYCVQKSAELSQSKWHQPTVPPLKA